MKIFAENWKRLQQPDLKVHDHLVILKSRPAAGHLVSNKIYFRVVWIEAVSNSDDSEDNVNFIWISRAINTK